MTLEKPSAVRDLPVRLCDVRDEVRLGAARRVALREPGWAHECFAAALRPSPRTYYVNESALPKLMRVLKPEALAA